MLYYSIVPTFFAIVGTFLLSGLIILLSFGLGSFLTSLSVQYRDVKHGIALIIGIWVYATPVAYPIELVPENLRFIYSFNPMVGIIANYRSLLLGTEPFYLNELFFSIFLVGLCLIVGIYVFNTKSGKFADVV